MDETNTLGIIIVEDETYLREVFITGLSDYGLNVRGVSNGVELDHALSQQQADIILLDLSLPGEDGLRIAERLRNDPALGIIILTGRDKTEDRIVGFDCGADNYFVKPVNIAELAAAITSLGRRIKRPTRHTWVLNSEASCLMTPKKISVPLTAHECILLTILFERFGENVPRCEIFSALNLPDDISSNPRLEVLVSRLRSKVHKSDPGSKLPLRARHSRGYAFLSETD